MSKKTVDCISIRSFFCEEELDDWVNWELKKKDGTELVDVEITPLINLHNKIVYVAVIKDCREI